MTGICYLIIAVMLVGGSQAQFSFPLSCDNVNQCEENYSPWGEIAKLSGMPQLSEKQLRDLCSVIIPYKECVFNGIAECTNETVSELAITGNRSVGEFATIVSILGNIMADLCDENSLLHTAYLQNAECLWEMEPPTLCLMEAAYLYIQYMVVHYGAMTGERQKTCLESAYAVGCINLQVKNSCGEGAVTFIREFFRRVTIISDYCRIPLSSVLKNEFLAPLEMDAEQEQLYAEVFDILAL